MVKAPPGRCRQDRVAAGRFPQRSNTPITATTGLRSSVEDRWRDAAKAAGKRADLEDIRAIHPDLVERESWLLASVLRQVVAGLPGAGGGPQPHHQGRRARARRPVVPPLGKGKGVLLVEDGGDYRGEQLH